MTNTNIEEWKEDNPREYGKYDTRRKGREIEEAEFSKYGWKVKWSNWFQNDEDFEFIGDIKL